MSDFLGKTQLTIEGLNAFQAIEKLKRADIPVFCARKTQKNEVTLEVRSKDFEKAFAILRSSCYNVKRTRSRGLSRLRQRCVQRAGLLVGALLFVAAVPLVQTRVLKIDVVGSGACYEAEVLDLLNAGGVSAFCAIPRDTSLLTAQIMSLPRVNFCSFRASGGILTVEVQVSDENALIESRPLLAPATGTIEELVVIRGTACAQAGDEVREGDVVVKNCALYGEEERSVIVIAQVKVRFPVEKEYNCSREEATAQALLEFGEIGEATIKQTENGYVISGTAFAESSVNLG